jgi:HlyD family secretion protein
LVLKIEESVRRRHWVIAIGIVVVASAFAAFQFRGQEKAQYFTSKAERGDIREVVEATGTINAVITVQVGSQVSGTISHLFVDFNSRVKKGNLSHRLILLYSRVLYCRRKEISPTQRPTWPRPKLIWNEPRQPRFRPRQIYGRTVGLTKESVMSPQQLDRAKANYDSAVAAVSAADAQVTQATAQVQQKEAALTVAQTNLDYTTIHAPIDGTVIARNVDVGQTVAASLQAPTLFTIAQDLTKMQVYASTDESA